VQQESDAQRHFLWMQRHDIVVRGNQKIDQLVLDLRQPHYPARVHEMAKELDALFTRRQTLCGEREYLEYSLECRGRAEDGSAGPCRCRCRELNKVPWAIVA
jgi:hypothetical protein